MSVLVIDVGTTTIRAASVTGEAAVTNLEMATLPIQAPAPGLLEVDASTVASEAMRLATRVIERSGTPECVGITNQRATTVVWDRDSGKPVAPAIGWQDLRTVFRCLELHDLGYHIPPNAAATKLEAILDAADPDRTADLCFGTVDTWIAWNLSEGSAHITDASNAAVTSLLDDKRDDAARWDETILDTLKVPVAMLPRITDSTGELGVATALPGAPAITAMLGDQQASLVGQGCTLPGLAKATFGTGGMLDACTGTARPSFGPGVPGAGGTIPIIAWQQAGKPCWGVEAIMISAGSCIEWLREEMGIIESPAASEAIAASVPDTAGVSFVPALMGLGSPLWDFGARAAFFGITRGTERGHLVRAVLEGIAHRGADLVQAAEADAGLHLATLRVDGGMSSNRVFVQALADLAGLPVEVSREREATTVGAGLMAGIGAGLWKDPAELAALYHPAHIVEPALSDAERDSARSCWLDARARAQATVPELSAMQF